MSRVGEIEFRTTNEGRQYFVGTVSLAGYKGRVYFVPNDDKRSDKAPEWIIREPRVAGSEFQADLGKAWEREGRENGTRYLDCYFDGAPFAQPLGNIRGFLRDRTDGPAEWWDLIYSRPKPGASGGAATGAAANGGDDEIPF